MLVSDNITSWWPSNYISKKCYYIILGNLLNLYKPKFSKITKPKIQTEGIYLQFSGGTILCYINKLSLIILSQTFKK